MGGGEASNPTSSETENHLPHAESVNKSTARVNCEAENLKKVVPNKDGATQHHMLQNELHFQQNNEHSQQADVHSFKFSKPRVYTPNLYKSLEKSHLELLREMSLTMGGKNKCNYLIEDSITQTNSKRDKRRP